MAQKSKPRTKNKSSYRGFEGVDLRKTHSGDESIALIENFRITNDGSLKKRSGFKKIYDGEGEIKASICITRDGVESCYFVQHDTVKKYTPDDGQTVNIGKIKIGDNNVFFFEYFDNVYLFDGYSIFSLEPTLKALSGYIPLYGKNWSNSPSVTVNEPPNMLTDKLAISYKLTPPATSLLPLGPHPIEEISSLYRNGVLVSPENYSLNTIYNSISINDFGENDEFFAVVKMRVTDEMTAERKALFSSHGAEIFYELNENNLFFWGSNNTNRIYYTKNPDPESTAIIEKHIPSGSFYIPFDNYFTVASESDRIKAFVRHYDRVLIMTEHSTWISDPSNLKSTDTVIRSINASIGCESFNGAVRIENTLISVGKNAIYSWTSQTDELNECNAYSISEPIKDLLPKDFFATCKIYVYKRKREIWLYGSSPTQLWIYNLDRKAWYKFSGFNPKEILYGGNEPRFFENEALYCFDDTLLTDIPSGIPIEIVAKIKSGELEFNSGLKKKLSGATLRGEHNGGELYVSVTLDGERTFSTQLAPRSKHFIFPFRIRSGSFSSLYFELIARGIGEEIIHGVEFNAD